MPKLLTWFGILVLLTGCGNSGSPDDFEVNATGETILRYTGTDSKVAIPSKIRGTAIREIGSGAFQGNEKVLEVVVPEGVTHINDYAFTGSYVRTVTLPNTLTHIGVWSFASCDGLNDIRFPSSLESIGNGAFMQCRGIAAVTLPRGLRTLGDGAFGRCSKLAAIRIEDGNDFFSVEDGVLFDRSKKTLIAYPEAKTDLKYYKVPQTVNFLEKGAFGANAGLVQIHLPVHLTRIGAYAFNGCAKLTHLVVPVTVDQIGEHAFADCPSLAELTFLSAEPPAIDNYIFGNSAGKMQHTLYIYVPEDCTDRYKKEWAYWLQGGSLNYEFAESAESFGEEE